MPLDVDAAVKRDKREGGQTGGPSVTARVTAICQRYPVAMH